MIFNTPFYRHGSSFEKTDSVSLCVPDESLTVREILFRSVKGLPLDVVRRDLYYDQDEDVVEFDGDFDSLYGDSYDAPDDSLPPDADIVDIHAALQAERARVAELRRLQDEEYSLSQREKMKSELLAELEASSARNKETSETMPQAGE